MTDRRSFCRSAAGGLLAIGFGLKAVPALAMDEDMKPALRDKFHGQHFVRDWVNLLGGNTEDRHQAWNMLTWSTQQAVYLGDEENFTLLRGDIKGWGESHHPTSDIVEIDCLIEGVWGFGGLFHKQVLLNEQPDGSFLIGGFNTLPVSLPHGFFQ